LQETGQIDPASLREWWRTMPRANATPGEAQPEDHSNFEIYRSGGTTPDISMMIRMVLVVRRFRNLMDERLRAIGQSASRMEALGAIMNMKAPKSQRDVAKRLRVEGATITRIIDILGAEGLVARIPDPRDRRINHIEISPKGEDALREIFLVYDEVRDHVLTDISEEEKRVLSSVLDRMLSRLDSPGDG
jgi:MarR family transcriptional regulator for hemolysin